MRKQYNSSTIKNKKITFFLMGVPLKGYVASKLFLDLAPEIKDSIVGIIQ